VSVQRGFSLLELLVVLAIAGLMSGLSVAWLDSGKAGVEQALSQLAAGVHEQAALARHVGQIRGLRWDGERPAFVRRDASGWVAEPVPLGAWPKGLRPDWPASASPQLVFTPDGWAQAGSVLWHWPKGSQRWVWQRDGQLRMAVTP